MPKWRNFRFWFSKFGDPENESLFKSSWWIFMCQNVNIIVYIWSPNLAICAIAKIGGCTRLSDFGCLRGSRVQPRQGSDNSRRARDTATTMLDHSRHRGESATKTVKFFAAHTVNCVICKNLSRIDWMLLNFTPVIQQNCHQPGRNFEKTFCAVDRLSCQLELSNPKPANSEAILLLIS